MIKSFLDKETAKVFRQEFSKKLPHDIQRPALAKLLILNALTNIKDLWTKPGLNAEKLSGKRNGQWSIRINKQWRICFYWDELTAEASGVEISDYH
ncbi:MAG: type II toxin-antitoxin system RelE/ParE family toxin [Prosthecobacter sp.]|nr:type II toxin-antitoxin system RelE/ParE family toxin [Prosthecobacter sp.]